MTRIIRGPIPLWIAFVLAHLWLGFLNLQGPGFPLGDVNWVYPFWVQQAEVSHYQVGVDGPWVYPIAAFVPMLLAASFGMAHYAATWLCLVFLLDLVAFAVVVGWRGSRGLVAIGWWWVAFLLLLGPIALGRIDSITVPIALVAIAWIVRRPRIAVVLLTLATWIKVWPAALIAALIITSRHRVRVIVVAAVTSLAIVIVPLALGSGTNVFSFVTQQTSRGLQIEAPVSTIWMWLAFARVPGVSVYYDREILTYQLTGPGVASAAAAMSVVLALAVVATAALGAWAAWRGAPAARILPTLSLALIVAFIAFNKVGSPQYIGWLAVPVVLSLLTRMRGAGVSFRVPAGVTLALAGLTQAIYPYWYDGIVELHPLNLLVLSLRNLLLFALLAWSVRALVTDARLAHRPSLAASIR